MGDCIKEDRHYLITSNGVYWSDSNEDDDFQWKEQIFFWKNKIK